MSHHLCQPEQTPKHEQASARADKADWADGAGRVSRADGTEGRVGGLQKVRGRTVIVSYLSRADLKHEQALARASKADRAGGGQSGQSVQGTQRRHDWQDTGENVSYYICSV